MTLDTSNRMSKIEVERSKVKVTGDENVKVIFRTYVTRKYIMFNYPGLPGELLVTEVIRPCSFLFYLT